MLRCHVVRLSIGALLLALSPGCGESGPAETVTQWNGYEYVMHRKEYFSARGVITEFAPGRSTFCSGPFAEGPGTTFVLTVRGKHRLLQTFGDSAYAEFIRTVTPGTKVDLRGSAGTLTIRRDGDVENKLKTDADATVVHVKHFERL